MNKPRYKHECFKCVFLGFWGEEDLYWCPVHLPEDDSSAVVYRMASGATGSLRLSTLYRYMRPTFIGWYATAVRLATQQRLIDKRLADSVFNGVPADEVVL